ncbi:MAG: SDR family oxidoreductase [Candidatus Thermoplasmatota archaeon]|nr:SDR family oxidoreductase [Candidatus Thermoplasmatota archaeon]
MKNMRVAITGAAGYFGRRIIERLEKNEECEKIVGISRRKFDHSFKKLDYYQMDVRSDKIGQLFSKYGIDTVIHLAFVLNPIHDKKEMHSINVDGARNVLDSAIRAGAKKIIVTSSTMTYGAWPDNPEFLMESSPLRGHPKYYYNKDKVEIEKLCSTFKKKNPDIILTILRPCLVLGPNVNHFYSRIINWPILPLVGGANPDMQFIHEDDVAKAYEFFLMNDMDSVFNIVGEGTMKWKEVIEMAGKRAVKIPGFIVHSLLSLLWNLRLTEIPSEIPDFVKYRWVASGEKAKKVGFIPDYTSKEALYSFLKK